MPIEPKKKWLILTGLLLGLLLSALDQTIVSTAMPTVVKDLGGLALYSWVFSIYMLASTTVMPIFGKLSDLYGRRRMYLIGMGFFIAGSALCGLASNMTELIVFRGLQGIGGGALFPLALTIIGDVFTVEERGKFSGIFSGVFALSSIVGPAVGGFITEHWRWEWIFYINLPLGIAAFAIIALALEGTANRIKRPIDWLGAITMSGSIVSFLLGLVLAGGGEKGGAAMHYAWNSLPVVGLLVLAAVLLALFLWIETKAEEPIVPLQLARNRVFVMSNTAIFFMSAGMYCMIAYIPLFVQGVIGVRPSAAGYILMPMMLSVSASSIIAGRLVRKVAFRTLIVPGMLLMSAGLLLMSRVDVHTGSWEMTAYMILTGLGIGPLMPSVTVAVQSAVGASMRGIATSNVQFFRSMGGTIGVNVMGGVLSLGMAKGLSTPGDRLASAAPAQLKSLADLQILLNPEKRVSLPQDVLTALQHLLANALHGVFLAGFAAAVIGLIAGLCLGKARLPKREKAQTAAAAP
ncbi:MDR family MFS transporter [Paenibacillus hamazuiensis]|uniref:MDR family MFS transporter n=1 Tax=Paenibacillus hamazuiensis TaxID=2936508 RepID=UPI0020105CE1|nr:MDR family MFS transporter [Paenibacillus hamazuiensis]